MISTILTGQVPILILWERSHGFYTLTASSRIPSAYLQLSLSEMGAQSSKTVNGIQKACLWKADRSPACRSVLMAVDAMKLNITEVDLDIDKGEHKSPEILAMNPQTTLPIFKDRNVILTDSHVINPYMANFYCGDSPLYPANLAARANQDHWLHYNNSVLYPKFRAAAYPMLYENSGFVLPSIVRDIEVSYSHLEGSLVGHSYFGGNQPTLADIALVSTISTLNVIVPIETSRFPQLSNWLYIMSGESFYKTANAKGLEEFCYRLGSKISSKRQHQRKNSAGCPETNKTVPIPKQLKWSDSSSRRAMMKDQCYKFKT